MLPPDRSKNVWCSVSKYDQLYKGRSSQADDTQLRSSKCVLKLVSLTCYVSLDNELSLVMIQNIIRMREFCITCIAAIMDIKSVHCSSRALSLAMIFASSVTNEFTSSTWNVIYIVLHGSAMQIEQLSAEIQNDILVPSFSYQIRQNGPILLVPESLRREKLDQSQGKVCSKQE